MSELPPLLYGGPRTAISRRFAALTVGDLQALAAAVEGLARDKGKRNKVDHGYWFAWYDGPKLSEAESTEVQGLFTEVVVAIASGLTGLDVARFGARLRPPSENPLSRLTSFVRVRPSRQLEDAAIGLMEDACAPWNPRLGFIAAWNAACSVAFRGRVSDQTEAILAAPWRAVFGDLPA